MLQGSVRWGSVFAHVQQGARTFGAHGQSLGFVSWTNVCAYAMYSMFDAYVLNIIRH